MFMFLDKIERSVELSKVRHTDYIDSESDNDTDYTMRSNDTDHAIERERKIDTDSEVGLDDTDRSVIIRIDDTTKNSKFGFKRLRKNGQRRRRTNIEKNSQSLNTAKVSGLSLSQTSSAATSSAAAIVVAADHSIDVIREKSRSSLASASSSLSNGAGLGVGAGTNGAGESDRSERNISSASDHGSRHNSRSPNSQKS